MSILEQAPVLPADGEDDLIVPVVSNPHFADNAPCTTIDPERFFDITLAEARGRGNRRPGRTQMEQETIEKTCDLCDHRADCLATAIRTKTTSGVWGGTGEVERKPLHDQYRKTGSIPLQVWVEIGGKPPKPALEPEESAKVINLTDRAAQRDYRSGFTAEGAATRTSERSIPDLVGDERRQLAAKQIQREVTVPVPREAGVPVAAPAEAAQADPLQTGFQALQFSLASLRSRIAAKQAMLETLEASPLPPYNHQDKTLKAEIADLTTQMETSPKTPKRPTPLMMANFTRAPQPPAEALAPAPEPKDEVAAVFGFRGGILQFKDLIREVYGQQTVTPPEVNRLAEWLIELIDEGTVTKIDRGTYALTSIMEAQGITIQPGTTQYPDSRHQKAGKTHVGVRLPNGGFRPKPKQRGRYKSVR